MSAAPAIDAATTAEPVAWAVTLNGQLRATLFVEEIARLMGLSKDRVQELCRTGRIPTIQTRPGSRSSRYLIPVTAYLRFLATYDEPIPIQ
jgi:excisionase family DNA binding protein